MSPRDCFIFFLWFGLDIVDKKTEKKFSFYCVDTWFWMETAIMKLKLHRFQLFRYLQRDLLLEVNFSFNINQVFRQKMWSYSYWGRQCIQCNCASYSCSQNRAESVRPCPCGYWDLGKHREIEKFPYSLNVGEPLDKPEYGWLSSVLLDKHKCLLI